MTEREHLLEFHVVKWPCLRISDVVGRSETSVHNSTRMCTWRLMVIHRVVYRYSRKLFFRGKKRCRKSLRWWFIILFTLLQTWHGFCVPTMENSPCITYLYIVRYTSTVSLLTIEVQSTPVAADSYSYCQCTRTSIHTRTLYFECQTIIFSLALLRIYILW